MPVIRWVEPGFFMVQSPVAVWSTKRLGHGVSMGVAACTCMGSSDAHGVGHAHVWFPTVWIFDIAAWTSIGVDDPSLPDHRVWEIAVTRTGVAALGRQTPCMSLTSAAVDRPSGRSELPQPGSRELASCAWTHHRPCGLSLGQLRLKGRSVKDLPHFHDDSVLDAEEEGVVDSDTSTRGLQPSPRALVCAMESCSYGGEMVVRGDRVDIEPEVWEHCVPSGDDGLKFSCVGDPGVAPDVERKLVGQQSPHSGEVLPIPAILEQGPGDLDRIHAVTLMNRPSPRHFKTCAMGHTVAGALSHAPVGRSRAMEHEREVQVLSLIHISEPTRLDARSRMPSSA